ncbi:hypothetical protein QBC35DRAFT_192779 [Podospora australis]|uniref:Extracellular matrix protein n=1 Tax=Podospora australis TaxID=1536484 RepID=A0AAN6WV33_9PEZI|nr:hypothetical protein QBC35DRAFT_192779 [Podospora australis]
MKFSVATVVAFAAAVLAKPEITNLSFNVVEGQPFTLTWRNAEGGVKVELMSGPDSGSLKPLRTLGNVPEGTTSFSFTPSGLPSGNYAFRITDESSDPQNYSQLIPYTGTGSSSSATAASSTGTVSRTSASASSTETETETETTTDTATETSTTGTVSSTGSVTVSTTLSTTHTSTTTSASRSSTQTAPVNTNNGQRFASSLALVLGTVAAIVFFN